MIYYPWGGGYAALKGEAYWCEVEGKNDNAESITQKKPLVTARFSLWGDSNDTSSLMVGVDAMVVSSINMTTRDTLL